MNGNPARKLPYQLEVINHTDIEAIHTASLSVLAETGAIYEDPEISPNACQCRSYHR